jgi:hypothetical protein
MKKTIMSVNTEPRIWDKGKHGPLAFIEVTFADGDQGSVACKPENAERVIGILEGLERKEFDFGLEAKDDYNGIKQWKVTGYPGKPGQQDGDGSAKSSGGGGFAGRRQSSPEDRSSIEAQVAAKIAGEIAVALINQPDFDPTGGTGPVGVVLDAIPQIAQAIRSAANGDSGSGSRPSGGPLPPPGSDEAEGGTPPASPSGLGWDETASQSIEKLKARATVLYGSAGAVMVAAKKMFPEVKKAADIDATMYEVLIEDKEQG